VSENLYAVVMAGGAGTRFWPLSRRTNPKQLQPLVGDLPLIAATVERLGQLVPPEKVLIITGADQAEATAKVLPQLPNENIIGEPEGRDTAAAIALAASILLKRDPEAIMAVMPADHVISPAEVFRKTLATAAKVAAKTDCLLLFGIKPSFAHTGLGYIHFGEDLPGSSGAPVRRVVNFTEKPDTDTAEKFIKSGEYYWNSGIFVWQAARIIREIEQHLPKHGKSFKRIAAAIGGAEQESTIAREYPKLEKISIDYAILEKAEDVAVLEANYQWDDVGSWLALERHCPQDAHGNVADGDILMLDTHGCILRGSGRRLIATVGIKDLLVIETDDAIMVCPKNRDQDVKKLVDELKKRERLELL
jgi:mannose-1-phosphate guanylyltransferase